MPIVLAVALLLAPPGESARIRSHLARVEVELRAVSCAALSPAQRAWRGRLLDELHRYWTRGRFPRNTFVDRRSPVFVDRDGTRCAVAELIAASGRDDLVARVAAGRNTAYVAELASDPELARWLDEHGFTAAEAARIQPTYQPRGIGSYCWQDTDCDSDECLRFDEHVSYCTGPCDADGRCPDGLGGAPMECEGDQATGRCVYGTSPPGSIGWPCGGEDELCHDACLTADEEPTCTYFCSSEEECGEGSTCRVRQDTFDATVCVPDERDRGCASGGAASGPTAALIALMLMLTGLRRGRAR
jgi:hypothetical protein